MNAPEIYEKLPFEKYRQLPGLHSSTLKAALESALDYQHAEQNDRADSDTFRQGRAAHTGILEPGRFLAEYVLWETKHADGSKRIRSGHAWEDFKLANAGKTILDQPQFDAACAVRDAVREHPIAGPLVRAKGRAELSLRWKHRSGADCKARLDYVTKTALLDIKTTHDIRPHIFNNTAERFAYRIQAALYRDGAEACGLGRLPFKIIAVRIAKGKPIDVAVYTVTEELIADGQEEYELAIDIVQACRKKQEWPGIATEHEIPLLRPSWAGSVSDTEPITFGDEVIG